MAVMMLIDVPEVTQEQYVRIAKAVEAKGPELDKGRHFHVAGPKPDGWFVLEVWEDQASCERYAEVLRSLLADAGRADAKPQILPVFRQRID